MEFPFGHRHHHHHHHHHHGHREEEEEEEARRRGEPYYPPPGHNPYSPGPPAPPPWEEHQRLPPPPPLRPYGGGAAGYGGWEAQRGYDPGPGYPAVQHVAHEVPGPGYPAVQHVAHEVRSRGEEEEEEEEGGGRKWWRHGHGHGHHHGGPFSFARHVSHETSGSDVVAPAARPRTVRVFTKAAENHSLSIRDGKVILAKADHRDEYQHWIKDEKFSTKVKDEEGSPCFALINKVTGEAIKHSIGATHPVRLVPYDPDYLDESILWTESHDTGEGFRSIRMVNNIRLNFDAFHGDDDHGGVHDGTIVVLWEWWKGKNQRWKIVSY